MAQLQDVGGIVVGLLGFLETGRDFVTAEAVIQLKDLLRRYPAIAEASLSSVSSIAPEASACLRLGSLCRNCTACVDGAPAPLKGHIAWLRHSRACSAGCQCVCSAAPARGWGRGPQMIKCTVQDIVEPEARAAFV